MKNTRVLDYVVAFFIIAIFLIINVVKEGHILGPIVQSVIIALIASFVIGTLTNLMFKRKN